MDRGTQIAVSGIISGIVAVLATVSIEKLGGLFGGVLSSSPTTIVIASLAIYYSTDELNFQIAMFLVAPGMLIDVLFLVVWRYAPRWKIITNMQSKVCKLMTLIVVSLSVAIFFGAILAVINAAIDPANRWLFSLSVAIASIVIQAFVGIYLVFINKKRGAPTGKNPVTVAMYLARFVCAGITIAGSVALAGAGLPVLSGLASTFPAIFLTTMAGIYWAQGDKCQAGAVGPMSLGSLSVVVFAMVAAGIFPLINPFAGAAICYVVALCLISIPMALTFQQRLKREKSSSLGTLADAASSLQPAPADNGDGTCVEGVNIAIAVDSNGADSTTTKDI